MGDKFIFQSCFLEVPQEGQLLPRYISIIMDDQNYVYEIEETKVVVD